MGPTAKWPRHCWFCWRGRLAGWSAGCRDGGRQEGRRMARLKRGWEALGEEEGGGAANEKWAAIIKKKVKWQGEGEREGWSKTAVGEWKRTIFTAHHPMARSIWTIPSICCHSKAWYRHVVSVLDLTPANLCSQLPKCPCFEIRHTYLSHMDLNEQKAIYTMSSNAHLQLLDDFSTSDGESIESGELIQCSWVYG